MASNHNRQYGKIFLFTLENIYFQTSVSVYVEDETEDSMSVYVFFSVTTINNNPVKKLPTSVF